MPRLERFEAKQQTLHIFCTDDTTGPRACRFRKVLKNDTALEIPLGNAVIESVGGITDIIGNIFIPPRLDT